MHGAASMNWLNHESGGLQGLSAPVIGRLHAETDWLPVRVQKRHLNWVGGVLEDPWSFSKISGSLEAESNFLTWRWLTSHEWPKPTMSIFQRLWESCTKGDLLNHLLVCVSMCPCTRYASKSILIRSGVLIQRQSKYTSISAGWQDLDVAGEKCSCSQSAVDLRSVDACLQDEKKWKCSFLSLHISFVSLLGASLEMILSKRYSLY